MNFYCLCMSPAIDATVRLPHPPGGKGEIFKDIIDVENVGGKGLNVARYLALRRAEVACGGLLGEDNAGLFVREMRKFGIGDGFVRVPGSTRRNEMLTWDGGAVKLNRSAFPGLDAARLPVAAEFCRPAAADAVAVLSGSLPPCWGKNFYAECVRLLKRRGCTVVLDASGEAMRLGIEAHPDVIKPNADECADLVGFIPHTPEEFRRATAMLREKVAYPIISDGGAGCWFNGEFIAAPQVEVTDTTAAGDTLLAEFCYRRFAEKNPQAGRWAVAAGSAACTMPGGEPPSPELVEALFQRL